MQQPTSALANPIQSLFDNPFQSFFGNQAFGGPDPFDHAFFGNPSDGNMIFHTASSFAQHGPDGVQYAQSQSHSYGPKGVRLCSYEHHAFVPSTSAIAALNTVAVAGG